jgi:predicted secreted protein
MTTDWILRCGDGENLKNSSKYRIWGISSKTTTDKHFIKNVKPGDRLWFVKNKSQGKLAAVATYRSHNLRDFGPLIDISLTNEELGWTGSGVDWTSDVEVHYTDLYGLNDCELLTHIKSPTTIRRNDEKCRVNLPVEYSYIVRYSKVTFEL